MVQALTEILKTDSDYLFDQNLSFYRYLYFILSDYDKSIKRCSKHGFKGRMP